jgi:hypothetical protein
MANNNNNKLVTTATDPQGNEVEFVFQVVYSRYTGRKTEFKTAVIANKDRDRDYANPDYGLYPKSSFNPITALRQMVSHHPQQQPQPSTPVANNIKTMQTTPYQPPPEVYETMLRNDRYQQQVEQQGGVFCDKCNQPASKHMVKKEGENKGKEFFACKKECNFFQWAIPQ